MSDNDEESVVSVKRSYGPGEDIFGKHDPGELVEDGTTDNSTDEEDEDDEEDEEEEDIPRMKKKHNIQPWDVPATIVAENLQDTFSETVEGTVTEHQNKDIQEAEKTAYEELKPDYLSELISHYKHLVGMTTALKKDPVHQRMTRTAKRLREEEDYDGHESMQYAIKKRKILIERKLDDYDPPRYEQEQKLPKTP